jgi:hypothetical protein
VWRGSLRIWLVLVRGANLGQFSSIVDELWLWVWVVEHRGLGGGVGNTQDKSSFGHFLWCMGLE